MAIIPLLSHAAIVCLLQGYQPMGGISVDAESKKQGGDQREGFYACKGVPWVPRTELEDWPDQWPSEVVTPHHTSNSVLVNMPSIFH